jgi:hypothetical protein
VHDKHARWRAFFGKGGPGQLFYDKTSVRLSQWWSPELHSNPVQRRLPRRRRWDSDMQQVMDSLLRKRLEQGMFELAPEPELPRPRADGTFDIEMVRIEGVPFLVPRTVYAWVHDYFAVGKSTPGEWREICNAADYNLFAVLHHCVLGGVKDVKRMLRRGDFLTKIDVRDAYPGIAIHPWFRDHFYVRHRFAGDTFDTWLRYRVLPFGVHDAPRAYTAVLRAVVAFLSSGPSRVRLSKLLDDILVAADTEEASVRDTQAVISVLQWLGFVIHSKKVELLPSQRQEFLGLLWDTVAFVARLTPARCVKVQGAARRLHAVVHAGRPLPLRFLASVLGQCQATRDAVTVAPLLSRELLRWLRGALAMQVHALGLHVKPWVLDPDDPWLPAELWDFDAVRANAGRGKSRPDHWSHKVNWDLDVCKVLSPVFLRARRDLLLCELAWWRDELQAWNGKWIRGPPPADVRYRSDASGYGAGLVLQKGQPEPDGTPWEWDEHTEPCSSQFHWRGKEKVQSINFKELATPELCLKALDKEEPSWLRGATHLGGELDNSCAVSYLEKMGGGYSKMSLLAERMWRWCLRKGMWHSAMHLSGVKNVQSDTLSRDRGDRSEWQLTEEAWAEVQEAWGPHSVDLFATRNNALLPRYFSRYAEPDSAGRDALRQDWRQEFNGYANPPYALLPQIIEKVRSSGCEITLVAPVWPAQPWLAELLELSVEPPRLLLSRPLLESTRASRWTQSQPTWSTAVWRISGSGSPPGAKMQSLRSSCWSSGAERD